MKKGLSILLSCILLASTVTSCDTREISDQAISFAQMDESHVQSVKNGTSQAYPGKTWGEAFDNFFTAPTWKYFKGTLEGPDEDEDGEPDYIESGIDVVEFTGYCLYRDTEVKARVQMRLFEDDTFKPVFLAFNEVPQNQLLLGMLIDKAFTTESEDKDIEDLIEEKADKILHGTTNVRSEEKTSQQVTEKETEPVTAKAEKQEEKISQKSTEQVTKPVVTKTDKSEPAANQNKAQPIAVSGSGQIFSYGATVYGMTTSYVCNNGSYETQWPVEDTWHITIKNTFSSHGVTWYECWDTDDGDYYGWIDGNYIRLYTDGIYKSGNVESTQYFDVNGDGISEVFVKSGTCEAEYMYFVYTPYDETLYEYLGILSGSHSVIYTENGKVYRDNAIQGMQNIYQISMSGSSIYEDCIYSGYDEPYIDSVENVELPRWGEVSTRGQYVCGFTSPGGDANWPVEDGWHITAVNKTTYNGEVWYDCYDTDDGDHYGWIKDDYIYFY